MVLSGPVVDSECRLDVLICHPTVYSTNQQLVAVIDTGATLSAIRSDIVTALSLPVVQQADVHGFGGVKRTDVVAARMVLMSKGSAVSKIRMMCVGDHREMGDELIFGMDALTGGILTVDMVKMKWEWRLMRVGKTRRVQ